MTSTSSDSTYATQSATGDLGPVTKSTSASTATGPSSANDPNATSSTTSSTSTPESVATEAGLSTGVKAGIGIGVAVVILVIAVLCFMVLRLRRRMEKPSLEEKQILRPDAPPLALSQDQKTTRMYNMNELDETSRVELSAQPKKLRPSELE